MRPHSQNGQDKRVFVARIPLRINVWPAICSEEVATIELAHKEFQAWVKLLPQGEWSVGVIKRRQRWGK